MAPGSSAAKRMPWLWLGAALALLPAGMALPASLAKSLRTNGTLPPVEFLPVQSKDAKDLGVAALLVAARGLPDPNFAQTVVLLIHDDADGIVGLILNRRTDVPLSRVFDDLDAAKNRSDPVYLGGPVETSAVFALLRSSAKVDGAEQMFGDVYLVLSKTLLERTIASHQDAKDFHVYLGYAGWSNEQLRKEVELGAWFIFPADNGTVFDSDPDSLWPRMIRKTEQKFADLNLDRQALWNRPRISGRLPHSDELLQ